MAEPIHHSATPKNALILFVPLCSFIIRYILSLLFWKQTMYGGLFGDLPSAKNSSSKEASDHGGEGNNANKQQQKQDKPPSVVSGLGTAGTSMAFVPTALRQRKRPAAALSSAPKLAVPKLISVEKVVEDAHDNNNKSTVVEVAPVEVGMVKPRQEREMSSSPQLLEEESDELRRLHESVTDFYDPLVPNDLLAYWERKAHEKQRLELERSARETLERQKRLREQLEQERQAIEATGDVKQIVQHRVERSMAGGAGRGRGRGVSNLPAWLVQKQQDSLGSPTKNQSLNEPVEGRTVLLSNLTAPGDVDDELAQEVQEECEETCGKVEAVHVQDAVLPHQPQVYVYVTFVEPKHAEQAARLFQGRQFGQRSITAKLVNRNV